MGMKTLLGDVLAKPGVERVRKNHGLEHATIHVLGERARRGGMAGRSDRHGFTLYGDVPTEVLADACEWALQRLARLPRLISLMTAALILAQPLGLAIQRDVTTSGDPGGLQIVSIKRRRIGALTFHRVETRG